jgi:Holliday junction resolvase RusA-like endonuclease
VSAFHVDPFAHFFITGKAEPQGSKQAFTPTDKNGNPFRSKTTGRIVTNVVDDNPKGKGWKRDVAKVGRIVMRSAPPLETPLAVVVVFYLARPAGHFTTTGKLSKQGRENPYPSWRPDATKLWRAAEDALTGIIWKDDGLIISQGVAKLWADAPAIPGVDIVVMTIAPKEGEEE